MVTADVLDNGVVAGNPARLIRTRFSADEVAPPRRLAWWDWPVEAVTQHARTLMTDSPADLAAAAEATGLIPGVSG